MPALRRGYLPRKPLPRKKIPADIRSLCRAYTDESVRHLAAIMRQPEFPPSARVQAIAILLDRGWGRAPQAHAGEDGENGIRVTIRHIIEDVHGVIIEGTPERLKLVSPDEGG
jgi:hypothetical protein